MYSGFPFAKKMIKNKYTEQGIYILESFLCSRNNETSMCWAKMIGPGYSASLNYYDYQGFVHGVEGVSREVVKVV